MNLVPESDLPDNLRRPSAPAATPSATPPERSMESYQRSREEDAIKILQQEYIKAYRKAQLNPKDAAAAEDLAAAEKELIGRGGTIPANLPPPPSAFGMAVEQAKKFATENAPKFGMTPEAFGGTVAGAGLGALEQVGAGPVSVAQKVGPTFMAGMAPPAPTAPAAPLGAAEQQARILQGTTGDMGTTGRARMQGFNVETAQQAARAKEAEGLIGALQRQGVAPASAQSVFAQAPGMTSSPSGVVYPRTANLPLPKPSGLDQVTQIFRNMAEMAPSVPRGMAAIAQKFPVISYPFVGESIGSDVAGIKQELESKNPDLADIVLRGAGALGTGMSLFGRSAGVGLPLAVAAPLVAAARRKFQAEANQPPATEEELLQAQRPSFRFAAPKTRRMP